MQVISRVYKQWDVSLKIADVFAHPTIAALAVLVQHGRKEAYATIQKVPDASYYPLSQAQSRLWILNKFEADTATYNMPVAVRIKGALDRQVLEMALHNLISRHESLRTQFTEIAGIPYQEIMPVEQTGFTLGYEDHSTVHLDEAGLKAKVEQHMALPFDLGRGPLFRAILIRLETDEHVFIYAMHHIVSDGWSMELIVKELFQNYQAICKDSNYRPEPLAIQYKDYAAWQQEQLQSGLLEESKAYWLALFDAEVPVLSIPADRPRPAVKTFNGAELKFRLTPDLSYKLKALAQQQDASLYMILLSAVSTLLFRYTGQEDIIIGTPVAGRDHKDLEDQIGFYVNTLPIRTQLSGKDTCLEVLQEVKEKTLGAYTHQRYPFDKLVETLSLLRDTSRSALFDVMVVLQNIHLSKAANTGIDGLQMEYFGTDQQHSKFDLLFNFYEEGSDVGGFLQYNTDLFDPWRMEKMVQHLLNLLEAFTRAPQTPIGALRYLSASEEEQLLHAFNDTAHPFPEQETLVSLFEARVAADPEAIAITFEGAAWTYAQIDKQSNELAAYLRNEAKVREQDVVALLLERSEWMVVALLGVLKAGAAYLPIDPAYPAERKLYMLEDAVAAVLITDEHMVPGFDMPSTITVIRPGNCAGYALSQRETVRLSPDHLAYIIYTSGSTGRPKGVMVPHRGIVNRIDWMVRQYSFAAADAVLQKTPYVFDVSVWEFFMTLCYGGKLVLCRKEVVFDPDAIITLAAAESVAHMHFVPSMFAVFLHALTAEKATKLHALRHIYCSGEALPAELVRLHHALLLCPLHNLYGPTEASVDVSYYETCRQDILIPIGKPIYNTQLYILDKARNLQPVGVPGELYIGGAGLAKGYRSKPELTAERFINDPFGNGMLYRTGDEARWLADGNIEYLGRLDDQVKIRGYRIELGEIEQALLQHTAIREAIVLIRKDQAKAPSITAYFVADTALDDRELRDFLAKSLPEYMIPVYFLSLEAMPLTTNGKADRKSLPDPMMLSAAYGSAYEAPRSLLERQLAEIWLDVIGRKDIGVTDNFFETGGHSLKATRLVYRIHESLNRKLELKDIFLYPTIRGLAALLEQTEQQAFAAIPAVAVQEHYELSHAQRRLWILDKLILDPLAYSMPAAVKLTGAVDREALQMALKRLAERHECLRTVFITVAEEPRQKIIPAAAFHFDLDYTDLRNRKNEEAVLQHIRKTFDTPFHLEHGPLFKAQLLQLADEEYVFVYVMHHIVSDGWSLEILIRDLMQLYKSCMLREKNTLAPLPVQYKDYAAWQNEQIRSGAMDASEEFWLQQFRGELPVLSLSTDYPRPAVMGNSGRNLKYTLGKDLNIALKKIGEQEGASLYMVLLSALYTLLYRYTGQEDLVIGTPIAGRTHKDLEHQIGFFVNTLALRNRFKGTDSCLQLLRSCRALTLDAFAHQQYPFDMLVDNLSLERDTSRSPLFDVMISLEDATTGTALATAQEGMDISDITIEAGTSNFDLSFDFIETGDDLVLKLQYNTGLFHDKRMERMLEHYKNILLEIVADPGLCLKDIAYLSAAEKVQLLHSFNDTTAPNPDQISIIDLFEEQVLLKPDSPALIFESLELTYHQLNTEVNKLAHYLIKQFRVQPGDHIGLMVSRSEKMLIYLLAILKAGAAYVPIDPEYPAERLRYMIEESALKLLLMDQDNTVSATVTARCNPEREAAVIDLFPAWNPGVTLLQDHNAYVIFTSGSTGLPKAVTVRHGNLLNIALGWRDAYELHTFDVCLLQMASISFDVFCGDLCRSLLNGGKMIIVPSGQRMDLEALYMLMSRYRVNILEATPALVIPLMDTIYDREYDSSFLKLLILGSDSCNADDFNRLVMRFGDQMRLINSYGTTETTIDSSFYERKGTLLEPGNVPVGRPMRNTRYYILDAHQQLLPVGHKGELYIGGAGVSSGYLNQPRLNAERFLPDPFNPGARMYRTGDQASWTEDGNACFWGRDDQQVKLRGYRIELGEIDHALSGFEGIHQALTVVQGKGEDQELVAYFTARETVDTHRLRDHLNRLLPAYMVPVALITLDAFPLSSNGKIDRKALPDPKLKQEDNSSYRAPETETEQQLAAIWQEVLSRERIGTGDNFFETGGHSLKATRVISKIHKLMNIQLPLRTLFAHPTIQSLAVVLDAAVEEKHREIKALPQQEYYALSHAQRRLWILRQLDEDKTAYNIPDVYEITGSLQLVFLEKALRALVSRHESLRTVFVTIGEEPMQRSFRQHRFPSGWNMKTSDIKKIASRMPVPA